MKTVNTTTQLVRCLLAGTLAFSMGFATADDGAADRRASPY